MSITSVRLSPDVEIPLKQLSQKLDRSKSYIINQALKEYIQRQAMEHQRWNDTIEALNSVKSGKLVDSDAVDNWLDSWGTENEQAPPHI
ncbi:MAG: transcriptional regulator [Gammaproteobacteria bacterium]|nr:MAG: transcriptional regulator [Gammaproteobacteria bacterium]